MDRNNPYHRAGFNSRKAYLQSVSDDYGVSIERVLLVADLLGPHEDFDGLISMIEDMGIDL